LCDTGHIRGKVSSLKIRYHHLKLARPNGWDGSIKQISAGPQISETRYACDVLGGILTVLRALTRRCRLIWLEF